MNKHYCELAASVCGFLGGSVLSLDALLALRHVRQERGKESLQEAVNKTTGQYVDSKGRLLNSVYRLQLWFAKRSVGSARLGFALVTVGFLLDLISKW